MPGNRNASQASQNNPNRNRQGGHRNRNQRGHAGSGNLPPCPRDLSKENMQAISAPYNFVPLADWVHIPEWGRLVSHDWPFKDGCSGEIRYRLIAESPLLIGGRQDKRECNNAPHTQVHPFRLPDGRYAIPGASLKGMLRTVVEIAGFGRMRMVDDRRLSVRDLTAGARKVYGDHMTKTVGNRIFMPKPKGGWLKFDDEGSAWITPCEYARVEHDDLAVLSGDNTWRQVPGEADNDKPAKAKYDRWHGGLEIDFDPGPLADHRHSRGNRLRYRKAMNLGHGKTRGTLVFTGQPSPRKRGESGHKHLEFIFFNERNDKKKKVSEEVWRTFRQIYENNADWNDHWKHEDRVPVFYLERGGEIDSFGLSLMYRLPYRHSIRQAIAHSSPRHLEEPGPEHGYDLADLLFGSTHSSDQNAALRGRVSFETAVALDNPQPVQAPDTILNSPKPSYYPNYIQQPCRAEEPGVLEGRRYRTLMDEDARLRGFKRYPARPRERTGVQGLTPGQRNSYSVQSRLHVLRPGTAFEGRILFHNLKPEELSALLWALSWGGDKRLRHGLGMGKPFGFGQVRFKIDTAKSRILRNNGTAEEALTEELQQAFMDAFESHMEQAAREHGGWKDSPQIRNLLAMADPEAANELPHGMALRHMCLDSDRGINEFQWAKQPPKENRDRPLYILTDYATATGRYQGPPQSINRPDRVPAPSADDAATTAGKKEATLHPWVEERIAEFERSHHARREDVLRGKLLAEAWAALEEGGEKQAIRESIVAYWKSRGWWDLDTKAKSMKKARNIYGGETS